MSEAEAPSVADPRLAVGSRPITEAVPAGSDIRGEPVFDELETEVRRMETEGPNAVRWRFVVERAFAILDQHSKDLLVAVWLTYGLTREESWQGLSTGLSILRNMIDAHWEAMQPPVKRERARVGAMEWLVGRLTPILAEAKPADASAPAILTAATALDDIDKLMSERLTKESVALGELVRTIRPHAEAARRAAAEAARLAEQAAQAPKPEEPAVVAPAAANSAPPAGASAAPAPAAALPPAPAAPPALPAVMATGADLDRSVSQLEGAIRQHAQAIRAASLSDPRSYVLTRTAAWLAINRLPPQQSGRTALPPPSADRLAALEALRQAANHAESISLLEGMVSSSPFFLDGHRLVCEALKALGPGHDAAETAVTGQVGAFIRRLPGLADLAFSDGRPFANGATRDWIGAMTASAASGDDASQSGAATLAKEATQLAAEGKLGEALALIGGEARRAAGGRERLMLQVLQTKLCLDANMIAVAAPLALSLSRTATEKDLDGWEPGLAVRVAEIAFRALSPADAAKHVAEDARRAALETSRIRLASLDPAAAARLLN